ncbi:hypothetical protein PRIPAC_75941 [Pristionchus pacificus]|uniref:Uncharacterized protein n=1 Tax=Pristionchus pacificus TaxID=54126 RepID=A0A2A6C7E1_PRIPA|nr:hypothetical protein PRIPAC_75941 [Pristionchus pacificus]|eukprot:PDM74020.1 hypothetical protein PRIPAC_41376 [Pristionchus pacificus]
MSGAEAHPPPPPPHGGPVHGHSWNPMHGEWHQYSRGPHGQHYYTYVTKYRRCGGRWGTGFVVGGLVGLWTASWWQRRDCHNGDGSCWTRGPWAMNRNDNNQQKPAKPEDITNQ